MDDCHGRTAGDGRVRTRARTHACDASSRVNGGRRCSCCTVCWVLPTRGATPPSGWPPFDGLCAGRPGDRGIGSCSKAGCQPGCDGRPAGRTDGRTKGIGQADIVGTSHGGSVALMLAALHPDRVRSLVLHAPANPFSDVADPLIRFYRTALGRWFAGRDADRAGHRSVAGAGPHVWRCHARPQRLAGDAISPPCAFPGRSPTS